MPRTCGTPPPSSSAPTTATTSATNGRPGAPGDDTAADIWGKPMVPQFEPLGHTPLMIHWPNRDRGQTPIAIDALTTNVDINATIADVFGVSSRAPHARAFAGSAAHRRGRLDPRLGDRRRLRQLGPGDRRSPEVRAGARRLQLPAVDVVEPLVDHARAQGPRGLHEVPESRPARDARLHARLRRAGDPPTVRTR